MPRVVFAPALQRHVASPARQIAAATARAALDAVFREQPELRAYVLDEQGALRPHVAVFVDGRPVRDRRQLADAVSAASEIYVVQALSGG